ncbi:MAG: LUD domain-containing protein [Planctomycetaceae bacterium]|nr:LUD domain-containing protein [Planctomycetaceae bacterium]
MSSRDQILTQLRSTPRSEVPLPEPIVTAIQYPDLARQFADSLASVGGKCVALPSLADLSTALAGESFFSSAKKICSCLPNGALGNVQLDDVADPHDLQDIDVAIVPAQFGIAENGAVWLTDERLKHRAILFINQHLIMLLPKQNLVATMQEAYARITFSGPGFGLFLSGPSKTADIEQSLVIGAHGPRSMTLYLLEDATGLA